MISGIDLQQTFLFKINFLLGSDVKTVSEVITLGFGKIN